METMSKGYSLLKWKSDYEKKQTTPESALKKVRRGSRVVIGSGCGEPQFLVDKLVEQMTHLADVEILHVLTLGKTYYTDACFEEKCRLKSFFIATTTRQAVAEGRADYTPVNLSDIPLLFHSGILPVDVALIQVSPPDEHGFCSLGVSVDIVKAAVETARYVVAQVNPQMPRTLGDSFVHVRHIDAIVEHEEPLLEMEPPVIDDVARSIGQHVAELVDDGATLRVSMGELGSACLYALVDKKHLGVHTDMLTDAYVDLIERGVITNEEKTLHPGKVIASFCIGTKRLFSFIHNNPMVEFHPIDYTNNYRIIARNHKMTSINSALEIDLTGQICVDSVGYQIYSGVGGAIDFTRGSRRADGGKAIMVLKSTTDDGEKSRIVPAITEGGGVVTTRAGVQYVVTEYGVAHLAGKSLRERVLELVDIAHPDFREDLMRSAYRLNLIRREVFPVAFGRYPEELKVKQIFGDELELMFRPVKISDETIVRNFLASLPRIEPYVRFLSLMKVYPRYNVQEILSVDYRTKMVLLGIDNKGGYERVAAMGGYVLDEESMVAEVDFAVHPDYGRRGVGSFLVQRLAEIAHDAGVRQFVAYVTRGQEGVFGVFGGLGYFLEISLVDNLYEIRLHLDKPVEVCIIG